MPAERAARFLLANHTLLSTTSDTFSYLNIDPTSRESCQGGGGGGDDEEEVVGHRDQEDV